jgi:replicative DNA helicase
MATVSLDTIPKDDLPGDPEAEQKIIGCLIVDSRRWFEVATKIDPDDFLDKKHAAVYRAIAELSSKAEIDIRCRGKSRPRLDVKPIADQLKANGEWRDVETLADYADAIGTGYDYLYYARRISECAVRRRIVIAAREAAKDARGTSNLASEIVDRAMSKIGASAPSQRTGARHIGDIIRSEIMPRLERDVEGVTDDLEHGVSTGFATLDGILGTMRKGSLIILAGRPSHGKTSLACNIACSVALNQGKRVLFVTLEQPQREIAESVIRSIAQVGPIDGTVAYSERRERFRAILECMPALGESETFALAEGNRSSVEWIDGVCRSQKAVHGLDFVVIDYLGLIKRPERIQLATYQIEYITNRLKSMAKELDVPLLCLCQLNRSFESDKTKAKKDGSTEPELHHLKDSGAIEQDADVVMFVWQTGHSVMGETPAKVKIAKNRHGRKGVIDLNFIGSYKRFTEPEPERNEVFDDWNEGDRSA